MIDPFDLNTAPIGEPSDLTQGQSSQWQREINIDPTLFTLQYAYRRLTGDAEGQAPLDQTIDMENVSGSRWGVDVTGAETDTFETGDFFWDLVVTRISDAATKVIDTGSMSIWSTTEDRRTHAQIMVTKIQSLLENRADSDVESYTIKQRSITKMTAEELRDWRDYYLREVANEPVVDGGIFQQSDPSKTTIGVRFR